METRTIRKSMGGIIMKRISVGYLKKKLKEFEIETQVFLSNKKTILQEPVYEYDIKRLWNWLHINGFLIIPEGNDYYSIEKRERR